GKYGDISKLEEMLKDQSRAVRQAAVEVLGELAKVGKYGDISKLEEMLKDQSRAVRQAAVEVLGELTKVGKYGGISKLEEMLEDENWEVRQAAVEVLVELTKAGKYGGISKLEEMLEDDDEDVRQAAVIGLAEVYVVKGDIQIEKVVGMLNNTNDEMMRWLGLSVVKILLSGKEKIFEIDKDADSKSDKSSSPISNETKEKYKQKALEILEKKDQNGLSLLGQIFFYNINGPEKLLVKAVETLEVLAKNNDDDFSQLIILLSKSYPTHVRRAALKALENLVEKMDTDVISIVEEMVEEGDVGKEALRVLLILEKEGRYDDSKIADLNQHTPDYLNAIGPIIDEVDQLEVEEENSVVQDYVRKIYAGSFNIEAIEEMYRGAEIDGTIQVRTLSVLRKLISYEEESIQEDVEVTETDGNAQALELQLVLEELIEIKLVLDPLRGQMQAGDLNDQQIPEFEVLISRESKLEQWLLDYGIAPFQGNDISYYQNMLQQVQERLSKLDEQIEEVPQTEILVSKELYPLQQDLKEIKSHLEQYIALEGKKDSQDVGDNDDEINVDSSSKTFSSTDMRDKMIGRADDKSLWAWVDSHNIVRINGEENEQGFRPFMGAFNTQNEHKSPVVLADISLDGKYLVTVDDAGYGVAWNIETEEAYDNFQYPGGKIRSIYFRKVDGRPNPDGFAVAGEDGKAYIRFKISENSDAWHEDIGNVENIKFFVHLDNGERLSVDDDFIISIFSSFDNSYSGATVAEFRGLKFKNLGDTENPNWKFVLESQEDLERLAFYLKLGDVVGQSPDGMAILTQDENGVLTILNRHPKSKQVVHKLEVIELFSKLQNSDFFISKEGRIIVAAIFKDEEHGYSQFVVWDEEKNAVVSSIDKNQNNIINSHISLDGKYFFLEETKGKEVLYYGEKVAKFGSSFIVISLAGKSIVFPGFSLTRSEQGQWDKEENGASTGEENLDVKKDEKFKELIKMQQLEKELSNALNPLIDVEDEIIEVKYGEGKEGQEAKLMPVQQRVEPVDADRLTELEQRKKELTERVREIMQRPDIINNIESKISTKQEESSRFQQGDRDKVSSSSLQKIPLGGVDLNPAQMDLKIQRNNAATPIHTSINIQDFFNSDFQGFTPVIINIVPAQMPLFLSELEEYEHADQMSALN
ncbi:hypothetical protein MNBD_UNCLBAC01-1970, partial [hydrothermal vent metagenome]